MSEDIMLARMAIVVALLMGLLLLLTVLVLLATNLRSGPPDEYICEKTATENGVVTICTPKED